MNRIKPLILIAGLIQLSCATAKISKLGWDEPLPAGVSKPERYELETNIQDLHDELSKDQIVSSARAALKSHIDSLCANGSTLLDSTINKKKMDPNTFNRWIPVKLVIQCVEPSYDAYKLANSDTSVSNKNGAKDIERAREEETLLTDLSQKCALVTQKSENVESCSKVLEVLETYSGPGVESIRTKAHVGLCIAAQKEQGIAAVKKRCSAAFDLAIQYKDTRNQLITAGILCMGTLDGAACVDAAKSADILRIKVNKSRLSSQLYEKGVALLAEECSAKIQDSCKRLLESSDECMSTPKFCRSVRLKWAPLLVSHMEREEAEKTRERQEERRAKTEADYLALQKQQAELQHKATDAQIDAQRQRLEMERRQLEIENQREVIRMFQSLFR